MQVMIVIDVRSFGEDLTLKRCAELYDFVHQNPEQSYIYTYPDKLWVSKWQSKNIFSNMGDIVWETWRGIPIEIVEEIE